MKAVVIKKFAEVPDLEICQLADLFPQAHEVKVSVKAIGINQADLLQSRGLYPSPEGVPNDIPGMEFAGIISDIGSGVNNFELGDRVFGLIGGGAYAEQLTIHSQCLTKMPNNLAFVEAAALPEVFITAYDALVTQMKLAMGEVLLISAIGSGVGLAAMQIAHVLGCLVIGTARSKDKLDKAKDLGLDHGILVQDQKFAAAVKNIVPGGVNVILELVGGNYLIEDIDCSSIDGRISLVGLMAGRTSNIDLAKVLSKRLLLKGTTLRSRPLAQKILVNQILAQNILPLLQAKKIKPIIDKTFPLADAKEALKYLAGANNFGKLVLTVD